MKLAEHRWVSALWCDDIRNEIGNKPSFMGVYTGDLVIPTVPNVLPRLCAFVRVVTPKSQPFTKLRVRVEKNDAPQSIAVIEIDDATLATMAQDAAGLTDDSDDSDNNEPRAISMIFVLMMGGIVLSETSKWIKVFVDNEGETLESFRLKLVVSPPPSDDSFPGLQKLH